jgi:hypothetical protein
MSIPRTLVGGLAARLLGAVLLLAAYAKAIDPQGFAIAIRDVLPMPHALASVGALALVAFEAALGAALLSGARHPGILVVTTGTFLAFTAVVVWQLVRPGDPGACGCFGQLLERTPWQAFWEDVGFVALSGLAWLGRPAAPGAPPWRIPALATGAFAGLAAFAPWLPLDDHATALAPGVTVASTRLDEVVPELRTGRHLVLLLDRADPATRARIPDLNARLALPGGATTVWGVAADDRALATEFMWAAGPAFEVRGAPPTMLRRLYRMLPRSALIEDGRVVATWTGFPPDPALSALARGESP